MTPMMNIRIIKGNGSNSIRLLKYMKVIMATAGDMAAVKMAKIINPLSFFNLQFIVS